MARTSKTCRADAGVLTQWLVCCSIQFLTAACRNHTLAPSEELPIADRAHYGVGQRRFVSFRVSALLTCGTACYTLCMTMRFEWDAGKSRINQTKHNGLDFETAARVFNDPSVVLIEDRIVEGEQRWHAIGAVSGALLLVVHV